MRSNATTGLLRRTLSFALVLVMLLGMFPMGILAAEGDINIRIHYYSEPSWGWQPAIQYWGGTVSVSDYDAGPTEIPGWGGAQGYTLKAEEGLEGWYSIVLTGKPDGFQFLNMANPGNNTGGKGYSSLLEQFTGSEPADVYCLYNEATGYNTKWYTDRDCTQELAPVGEVKNYSYTVHYANPDGWTSVNAYAFTSDGENPLGAWSGTAAAANALNGSWYDVSFTTTAKNPTIVFNNGSDSQTADQKLEAQGDSTEIWVTGNGAADVVYAAPSGWATDAAPAATYIIAGTEGLCGIAWDPSNTANQMTLNSAGKYEKVYAGVPAGKHEFKVTDGTWNNSWGVDGGNYVLETAALSNITVLFDAETGEVTATAEEVKAATYIIAGTDNLCGTAWDPSNTANQMTLASAGVYEKFYAALPAGDYQFKVTDGTWDNSWGSGNDNYSFTLESASDVTVRFEEATKAITLDIAEKGLSTDYYLVGWINGADYGCNGDYQNLGEYKFVGGKLTATFQQDSYVFVKTGDNANWYMAESYCTDTTVTLKTGGSEKLFVPAGAELNFTLAENTDGSLTLSYKVAGQITPIAPEKIILAGNGADIGGGKWLNGSGWAPGNDDNKMTETSAGIYEITYTDVPMGNGYAFKFAANGDWNALANWGGTFAGSGVEADAVYNSGNNITFDVLYETADVTIRLDLTKCDATTKSGAKFTVTIAGKGEMTYTANLHFQKPEGWATVNGWIWGLDGKPIAGYEQYNTTWPGTAIEADAANPGWYTVSLGVKDPAGFNFLFNDGTGNQTSDLVTGALEAVTDLWIADNTVSKEAPAGWIDSNRTLHVPGTFPGPSWDAASNQMTYDPDLGLYVYTFKNVPAANYEYKISVNGSWNENYGANAERDGSNIAVTVPETMDVTVYYNDTTHNTVTSVDYVFAEVILSGTGIPAGTKLTDEGLTGIYTAQVEMTAGTYADIQLSYNSEVYTFAAFELTADKAVNFYFDPATGIYYHDGSDAKVGAEAIYYDSGDTAYKAPFGAVEQGSDVTFAITTGEDVSYVKLVVKGIGSFDMAQPEAAAYELGVKQWTCTVQFDKIGEYDYYFAISNGSDVKVYGDDDGYYGTGKLSELTEVMPYDLVVYEKGFQTPDWMKNAVIYQIFPDRFFDGDPSNNQAQTTARGEVDYEYIPDWYVIPENPEQKDLLDEATYKSTGAWYGDGEWSNEIYGGDLEGIVDRIGYLKALGVNVIYLNPVFASISNHRYDACDYMEIDPILGDLGDFEALVAAAEANGMHIILDGVFNHVSDDSVYFDRYYKFLGKSEKIGAYPYWAYVYDYMAEQGVDQAEAEKAAKLYFGNTYGITDWSYTEWFEVYNKPMADAVDNIGLRAGKAVYSYDGWWGYDSMPIIYSTNGSEYQTGNWAEEIIYNESGDSVTQYWIAKGNDGWRLDVANEVSDETWQHFRDSVKAMNSDAVIVGEIWDDATKYLMGDMYDSVMNYLFRNAVTGFAKGSLTGTQAAKDLEKIRERYPEEAFYAMMNLVGSHDTTRLLSYLDGIGDDRNQKDIDSAFPTYAKTSDAAKAMQYLVAFLQFTYPGAPTIYYGDEIGMVGADDPDDRRAMEWGKGNRELVEWYAKLAAIREAYPALRTGSIEMLDVGDDNLMGYTRTLDGVTLAVYANNAATDFVAESIGEPSINLITGKVWDGTIPARSGVILIEEAHAKEITVNYAGLAPAYDPAYLVPVREPAAQQDPFTDVSKGDACYESVLWALDQKIAAGTTATTFSPDATCTRAQLVTFLWRANGSPVVTDVENPFQDVSETSYYYNAVLWAWANGITGGTAKGIFNPSAPVTRAQAITFLWRAQGSPKGSGDVSFTDVPGTAYYYEAICWAAGAGVALGTSAGTFQPNALATRGQAMIFLYQGYGK